MNRNFIFTIGHVLFSHLTLVATNALGHAYAIDGKASRRRIGANGFPIESALSVEWGCIKRGIKKDLGESRRKY